MILICMDCARIAGSYVVESQLKLCDLIGLSDWFDQIRAGSIYFCEVMNISSA
jgi:hypothetical protein